MAKKGNKKKSNARKTQQQKKVVTTPTATTAPATPEESSPVTAVNALADTEKALLTQEPQVAAANIAAEKEIKQIEKEDAEEEEKPIVAEKEKEEEEEENAEKPSILSNASEQALTPTSENIVESLQVKDTLEEPPHVQVKAEPVAVVLDSLPETEQPVVITLEKAIIPEEQQSTIEVEPVPEEISPVLPKVETEEDIPLLQEKKQDQEPIVLVVSESEATTFTSPAEEEATTAVDQDQLTSHAVAATATTTEQDAQVKTTESDPVKPQEETTKTEEAPAKVEEAPVKSEQEPEQAITQVPEQKEPKSLLVPQATESETKNVQAPHVSEPTINVVAEEPAQEQAAAPSTTATTESIDVSKVAPPIVIVNNVDQYQEQAEADVDVPAQTEKETAPPVSTTSLDKEDTPTIRSQSVLTSTNTDATMQEEDEIVTPKSSLKKKRSMLGKDNKSVTKRKSQILGLFKRGGDKTPPPVPELPVIQQAAPAEKKLNKRKSWMFWKSSNNNATAVATGKQKN